MNVGGQLTLSLGGDWHMPERTTCCSLCCKPGVCGAGVPGWCGQLQMRGEGSGPGLNLLAGAVPFTIGGQGAYQAERTPGASLLAKASLDDDPSLPGALDTV